MESLEASGGISSAESLLQIPLLTGFVFLFTLKRIEAAYGYVLCITVYFKVI